MRSASRRISLNTPASILRCWKRRKRSWTRRWKWLFLLKRKWVWSSNFFFWDSFHFYRLGWSKCNNAVIVICLWTKNCPMTMQWSGRNGNELDFLKCFRDQCAMNRHSTTWKLQCIKSAPISDILTTFLLVYQWPHIFSELFTWTVSFWNFKVFTFKMITGWSTRTFYHVSAKYGATDE